jgi:hypothetical protein
MTTSTSDVLGQILTSHRHKDVSSPAVWLHDRIVRCSVHTARDGTRHCTAVRHCVAGPRAPHLTGPGSGATRSALDNGPR